MFMGKNFTWFFEEKIHSRMKETKRQMNRSRGKHDKSDKIKKFFTLGAPNDLVA